MTRDVEAFEGEEGARLSLMVAPEKLSVPEVAVRTGVAKATLYLWQRAARAKGLAVPGGSGVAEGWSARDKFGVVVETAGLSEAELAEYCRALRLRQPRLSAEADCIKLKPGLSIEASAATGRRILRSPRGLQSLPWANGKAGEWPGRLRPQSHIQESGLAALEVRKVMRAKTE